MAVSRAVQLLKGGSSRWIHSTFPDLVGFGWQDGYGAFSVSRPRLASTLDYVARQRERHEGWSFELEYRELLERHQIEYDLTHLLDEGPGTAVSPRREATE
ncbi:MAG: transposase [Chloroflexi bacterium]|nr:transposase [Chloroflexota bacterium]